MKYIYTICAAAACLLIGQAVLSTTFATERRANGSFPFGLRTSMEDKMATSEHRRLKSVDLVGGSSTPPANRLPLQECEGDCDRDRDVRQSLKCLYDEKMRAKANADCLTCIMCCSSYQHSAMTDLPVFNEALDRLSLDVVEEATTEAIRKYHFGHS